MVAHRNPWQPMAVSWVAMRDRGTAMVSRGLPMGLHWLPASPVATHGTPVIAHVATHNTAMAARGHLPPMRLPWVAMGDRGSPMGDQW